MSSTKVTSNDVARAGFIFIGIVLLFGMLLFVPYIALIAMVLGIIPGAIARNKGLSFFDWWLYGSVIFIAALPGAILAKPNASAIEQRQQAEGHKKCPFCAEMIKADAIVCRYCGRDLPVAETAPVPKEAEAAPVRKVDATPAAAAQAVGRWRSREEYERWKADKAGRVN